MIECKPIPPWETPRVWGQVEKDVGRAIRRGPAVQGPQDVRKALLEGDMGLILVEEDGEYRGCCVVQQIGYPQKKSLRVVILGGKGFAIWGQVLHRFLLEVAGILEVDMLEMVGRPGWPKLIEPLGWSVLGVHMTCEVGDVSGRQFTENQPVSRPGIPARH